MAKLLRPLEQVGIEQPAEPAPAALPGDDNAIDIDEAVKAPLKPLKMAAVVDIVVLERRRNATSGAMNVAIRAAPISCSNRSRDNSEVSTALALLIRSNASRPANAL